MSILARVTAETEGEASGFRHAVEGNVKTEGVFATGVFEAGVWETGVLGDRSFAKVQADIDATIRDALRPAASVQQVGLRLTVDGTEVQDYLTAGGWTVSRNLERAIQVGSFQLGIVDGKSQLGSILNLGAPASGLKPITISLAYKKSDRQTYTVPLITGGIADQTEVQQSGTLVETLTVADVGRKYRDVGATVIVPAGSNLKRHRVIQKFATAAGLSSVALAPMEGRVNKSVNLLDGDWMSIAQQMADVEGARLLWDPSGSWTWISDAAERERPQIRWLYNEAHIIRTVNGSPQPFRVFPAPEAWTEVEARGNKQITRESCGLRTKTFRSFGLVDEVSPVYTYLQSSASGTVSNEGLSILTGSRVGSRTITEVTFRCRDIIVEKVRSWALLNPSKARYRNNADGTRKAAGSGGFTQCWLLANDPTEIGHYYHLPHLLLVEETINERLFVSGKLKQVRKTTRSWYNPRRHTKSRASISDAWETQSADSDWWDLGNGEAVVNRRDQFIVTERVTEAYSNTEDNFVRTKTTRVERYAKKEGGGLYLYGDGSESSDSQESFRLVSEVTENWVQINEEFVAKNVARYGIDRKWLDSTHSTDFGTAPATEVLETTAPVRANFDTDEEFEAAKHASSFDQQEIVANCTAPNLLTVRPARKMSQAFFEWAETEDELEGLCARLLLLGMSPGVEFTVPINGNLREGDYIHVRNRTPGINVDHDVKVKEVRHQQVGGGAKVTRVRGLIWADRSLVA